jgi:hypothetical protein
MSANSVLLTPVLLGITGKIGSGKSTVTEYLKSRYNMLEYMFAGPLKKIAIALGFEEHQAYGTQEQKLEVNKFWGISGRKFLQVFGSEVCRDYLPKVLPDMNLNNSTLWVRLFEKFYEDMLLAKKKSIVCSDVRFEDESNSIKERGGIVIGIERPDPAVADNPTTLRINDTEDGVEVGSVDVDSVDVEAKTDVVDVVDVEAKTADVTASHLTHQSEMQADLVKPHFIIVNDGSLEDLYNKIDVVYGYLAADLNLPTRTIRL